MSLSRRKGILTWAMGSCEHAVCIDQTATAQSGTTSECHQKSSLVGMSMGNNNISSNDTACAGHILWVESWSDLTWLKYFLSQHYDYADMSSQFFLTAIPESGHVLNGKNMVPVNLNPLRLIFSEG